MIRLDGRRGIRTDAAQGGEIVTPVHRTPLTNFNRRCDRVPSTDIPLTHHRGASLDSEVRLHPPHGPAPHSAPLRLVLQLQSRRRQTRQTYAPLYLRKFVQGDMQCVLDAASGFQGGHIQPAARALRAAASFMSFLLFHPVARSLLLASLTHRADPLLRAGLCALS